MVTRVRNGKRRIGISDSMLMQLPTPLDCISRTPRWPPVQAPARSATPSSSVVKGMPRIVEDPSTRWISFEWPASGT
ncbi:hypothetical protein ACVIWV_004957 [Bradyrhizobium diazoefficiens]